MTDHFGNTQSPWLACQLYRQCERIRDCINYCQFLESLLGISDYFCLSYDQCLHWIVKMWFFPPFFIETLITKRIKKRSVLRFPTLHKKIADYFHGVVLFGVCSRVVHFWRSMTCSVFVCLLSDSCMHVQGKHCWPHNQKWSATSHHLASVFLLSVRYDPYWRLRCLSLLFTFYNPYLGYVNCHVKNNVTGHVYWSYDME